MTGTVAMLFRAEPRKDPTWEDYSVLDDAYIGSVWVDDWVHWFGNVNAFVAIGLLEHRGDEIGYVVTAEDLKCHQVVEINLTASWNEHGQPIGLDFRADN